jgi:hypothetical protein
VGMQQLAGVGVVLIDAQQNVEGSRACGRDGHKKAVSREL